MARSPCDEAIQFYVCIVLDCTLLAMTLRNVASLREDERMILEQSYVLLAVAIVVALINFFGAYFAVREARRRNNPPYG
jgi:hypothetical protein